MCVKHSEDVLENEGILTSLHFLKDFQEKLYFEGYDWLSEMVRIKLRSKAR